MDKSGVKRIAQRSVRFLPPDTKSHRKCWCRGPLAGEIFWQGPTFLAHNQAKYNHRLQIRNGKAKEKLLQSHKLSDDLCTKNTKRFWKTWKSKFSIKIKTPCVNGYNDDQTIADCFPKTY